MSGIFPRGTDGGIAPNPLQPSNPAQAFNPALHPLDTAALYYGNGCDVRLRPHVVNSLISEIVSTADRAGVAYRAASLENLELSVRYLIQRGLPHAAMLVAQDVTRYAAILDPVPPFYTDFLTITFVPDFPTGAQNAGEVRINLNGLGYVPLLRNDGEELAAGDIKHGKPFIAAYFQGAFYYIGLCFSQVPMAKKGAIDVWIRTDGNDETGDGTENTPDKAFRTIRGAWYSVGARFIASPLFSVHFKLGIPGVYEHAEIGPFGSSMSLTGDVNNRWAYRISCKKDPEYWYWGYCMVLSGCSGFIYYGVTFQCDYGGWSIPCYAANSAIALVQCGFDVMVSSDRMQLIAMESSSYCSSGTYNVTIRGNGHSIHAAIAISASSVFRAVCDIRGGTWTIENLNCIGGFVQCLFQSTFTWCQCTPQVSNVTGPRFFAQGNAVVMTNVVAGNFPGNSPGTATSGSQVIGPY